MTGTYAGWLVPIVQGEEIAVPKHAIARGHQRLRDSDWRAVQSELREAALQAALVQMLSMALGLKQFAIPAVKGLVIGDVGESCLSGKTFIVPPYSRRWGEVFDAWLRFQAHLTDDGKQAIEAMALDHETEHFEATAIALAEKLQGFAFLRQRYVAGDDRVGDLWAAARGVRE